MKRLGVASLVLVLALPAFALAARQAAYVQSDALPAPEANQAAATDDRFVYVIDNTRIAKYDRATRERIGISTGEAHHLNSGFMWEGRVYAAHSNYPAKPERSEIRVLDPQSMALSTFKEFGDYRGSLTWAVRRPNGHWWCTFAHYGADNAKTVLVELDGAWKELGAWTYPSEVIQELGQMSISGGLWQGDTLLTTGHDRRVIYRLRVPKQGTVLELIDKVPSPFPGQGIATDERTGGLVGIDRAKRQVVFARFQAE